MTGQAAELQALRRLLVARARKLGLSRDDAEDAAQDTLLAVMEHAPHLSGIDLVRWGFTVLRNATISRRRSGAYKASRANVGLEVGAMSPSLAVAAPQDHVVLLTEAMKVLDTLPQRAQRLLRAATIDQNTFQEMADREKLPMGSLKSSLHRAQALWRTRLTAEHRAVFAA